MHGLSVRSLARRLALAVIVATILSLCDFGQAAQDGGNAIIASPLGDASQSRVGGPASAGSDPRPVITEATTPVRAVAAQCYDVQTDDSLGKIARAHNTPGGWQAWYDANRHLTNNPNFVRADWCLNIPDGSTAPAASAPREHAAPAAAQTTTSGGFPLNQTRINMWEHLAVCEASGNWANTSNRRYSGGLQFAPGTWSDFGGRGIPAEAPREVQMGVAELTLAAQGWNAWPVCSREQGVRHNDELGSAELGAIRAWLVTAQR